MKKNKQDKSSLRRTIGKKTLLFITVNAILGTGIFFLPAIGAVYAGSASLLSWIIMSFIAIVISLYFAELVSLFPSAGGVYEFIKRAFGEFYSFIFGWIAWIVANITIAMLVVGSIMYLFPNETLLFNAIFSVSIIVLFNYISYRGMNISSRLLLFFGLMTVATLLVLIIPGIPQINPAAFDSLFVFSFPAVFLAIYFISETFFGWETATYLSEEIKNVRKVLPKTLVIATIIISILAVLTVFVSIGVGGWEALAAQNAPLVFVSSMLFGSEFSSIFALLIFIPLIGTAATWIVSSPRLLYAMSRDKVLLPKFGKIHKKYGTPHIAILFQTIITCAVTFIGFADFRILLSLLLPLILILYSGVLLSVVKLRISKPNLKRHFKAPFGKVGPILIVLFNATLLCYWLIEVQNSLAIFSIGLFLIFIGAPMYIVIKLETDDGFIERFFDKFSWFFNKTFTFWYTQQDVEKVIKNANLKKGQTVLDFGCGTGITTLAVAKKVGKDGTVVAVDLSQKQLEKAIIKVEKALDYSNVIFIKERELTPFGKVFDKITCVGVLEHFEDPSKKISGLFKFLKNDGAFSFMSFGNSLGMPSPAFLRSRETIAELFKSVGMKVKIERIHKRGVTYWFIYGKK